MAQIQRGDLRGTNDYEKGLLGTKEIRKVEGQALDEWDIRKYYSDEKVEEYIADLVEGRRVFTEEIASEGLREEIIYAAERSYRIHKNGKSAQVSGPEDIEAEVKVPEIPEFKSRPRRGGFWRSR
jgi:phosphoenolpyruvate carboxykinase (ATP)